LAGVACGNREDVAAVILGGTGLEVTRDAGGGTGQGETGAAAAVIVIGQLGARGWPHPVAEWPLDTPLAEFFAGDAPPNGRQVRVTGADALALMRLWDETNLGQYGPQPNSLMVQDAAGDQYLILFRSG
jgi:hypothetical protein